MIIPVFRTERLTLREPRIEDVPAFAAFLRSERARFVGGPGRELFDSARAFGHMTGLWVLRGWGPHVICLQDGTAIGHGGPWQPYVWPEPELGWCLWNGAHEGKGYATEAMVCLRDWALHELKLPTLVSYIDPENHASRAVAQRLGGQVDDAASLPDAGYKALVYRYATGARA